MLRLFLILLHLSTAAAADDLTTGHADELLRKILVAQKLTRTWSASFSQTLVMPGLREPVRSEGSLYYQSPDWLRLDYSKPQGEFILVVGDHMYMHRQGGEAEIKSLTDDFGGKPLLALLSILRGQPSDQDAFYAKVDTREGGEYLFALRRKQDAPQNLPLCITNRIGVDQLDIREIVAELPNGGLLKYNFRSVARNQSIDVRRFMPPTVR